MDANQAGSANYNAATPDQQSFSIGMATQSINFSSVAPTAATVGGPAYTVAADGGSSTKPVTFSLDASSTGCAITGTSVTFTAVRSGWAFAATLTSSGSSDDLPLDQARSWALDLPVPE